MNRAAWDGTNNDEDEEDYDEEDYDGSHK